jgi:hypothetical protein
MSSYHHFFIFQVRTSRTLLIVDTRNFSFLYSILRFLLRILLRFLLQSNYCLSESSLIPLSTFSTNMAERQRSSHRRRSSRRDRSKERMEDHLNRSSYDDEGILSGYPSQVGAPRSSRVDSCESEGVEPFCPEDATQPIGAIPAFQEGPPEGNVAKEGLLSTHTTPVGQAELACADGQGDGTGGPICGAVHSGPQPTVFLSSGVTDEEADARSEWRYKPRRQASKKSASGDTEGRLSAGARGYTPRTSLASRTGESHTSDAAIQRIESVMVRMEQRFAASTTAFESLAAHVAPSVPGESISFHSFTELSKFCLCCAFFYLIFFLDFKKGFTLSSLFSPPFD